MSDQLDLEALEASPEGRKRLATFFDVVAKPKATEVGCRRLRAAAESIADEGWSGLLPSVGASSANPWITQGEPPKQLMGSLRELPVSHTYDLVN